MKRVAYLSPVKISTLFSVLLGALFPHLALANDEPVKTCVYIASYAPGYDWQDELEVSLIETLKGKCQIHTFYMDSKRVFQQEKLKSIGKKAAEHIEAKQPDVVIVSDDHAVQFVLQPYYKDSDLPFVYCGLNKSGKMYGLPYSNTSGMIEKSPIGSFLKILFNLNPSKTHVAFLSTKGTTENKNFSEFEEIAKKFNISYSGFQVGDHEGWLKAYKKLQEDPSIHLILFANYIAISDWEHPKTLDWISKHNKKLSIAVQHSVMPYVALGMTKVPKEQGEWAGMTARAILEGIPPNKIAVVPNQQFQFWINNKIAKPFIDKLPDNIISQSIVYKEK